MLTIKLGDRELTSMAVRGDWMITKRAFALYKAEIDDNV